MKNKIQKKKILREEGGLLNVYVVFRGGLPNVYVYLQGGRGGQKWPKSCLRNKSMAPYSMCNNMKNDRRIERLICS